MTNLIREYGVWKVFKELDFSDWLGSAWGSWGQVYDILRLMSGMFLCTFFTLDFILGLVWAKIEEILFMNEVWEILRIIFLIWSI